jgi:hypothetical protein
MDPQNSVPLCPSAQTNMDNTVIFGLVGGTVAQPRVNYLSRSIPGTSNILSLAEPVEPAEVFRIAAPCAQHRCQHFGGEKCRLAERITETLPPVVSDLPPCRIRPHCRWWQEHGRAACVRCPQIVTETYNPSDDLRRVASPTDEQE